MLARTLDAVIFAGATLAEVMPWLWMLLGLFVLRAGLFWAAERAGFQASVQVRLQLRRDLYQQVRRLGPAWLDHERSGALVTSPSRKAWSPGSLLRPLFAGYESDAVGAAGDSGGDRCP
ncbi:MAG: hypothetical protein R3E89_10560 [Thiolinea sp.]